MEMFYQYIMAGVQVFFGFSFFIRFLQKKMKPYFYFLFGGCAVCLICFAAGRTFVELVIFALSLAAAGIFVCHADWRSASLYAVLTVEVMQLSYGIVKSLLSILYPYLSAYEQNTVGFLFMLLGELAALLLTWFCYVMVQRHFPDELQAYTPCPPQRTFIQNLKAFFFQNRRYEAVEKQYILLAFIPVLMIFIMDEYINSFIYGMVVIYDDGMETTLYTNHYQMLTIQLLGMGSLFCILFACRKLLQNFRLSTELTLLEQEEYSLNQYVEEAKAHYEETKSFRHDIRNHITVIKKLLQGGKLEQAINYIEDMDDMAEKMSFPCSTNNPVVDILVENKLGLAKSMGIRADCSLLLPYPCGLRDIDICVVLSNALDNAIYACKSLDAGTEKYIHVSGRMQGDFLMMEVENSFHGKSTFKRGTGLSNVKTVAEKYGGTMSIETGEGAFVLHVLLIIPQHPESIPQQMD